MTVATTFTRKGYGRIYVADSKFIKTVEEIIQNMDENEAVYMPKDMVSHVSNYPAVVYIGKFDELDLDALTIICFKKGIFIWCFDSCHNEHPEDLLIKYPTAYMELGPGGGAAA
jgi:hypothetical protein